MPCPIEDDAVLLRAVRHDPEYIHPDENTGGWIPTKRAITFERGSESVFCEHLLRDEHSYVDVAMHGGTEGVHRVVFTLRAGDATGLDFGVDHSPNEDSPIGYAHGDVDKPTATTDPFRTVRQRLLTTMQPVDASEITLPRP